MWNAHAAHAEQIDSLLPERSEQEIIQKWNEWMKNDPNSTLFTEAPSVKAPYSAGAVSDAYSHKA